MKAIVDRIEGRVAVLEIQPEGKGADDGSEDGTAAGSKATYLDVSLDSLPAGTRQGDAFDGEPGHWTRDDAYRAERERINDDLRRRLFK